MVAPGLHSYAFEIFRSSPEKEGLKGCQAGCLTCPLPDRSSASSTPPRTQALHSELAATWVSYGDGSLEKNDRAVAVVERYR